MDVLSLDLMKTYAHSKGLKMFPAKPGRIDILFSSENYQEFLELVELMGIRTLFYMPVYLNDDDLDEALITPEDDITGGPEARYLRDFAKAEIEAFNKKIKRLRARVGEEQSIHLFFQSDGVIYDYNYQNDELIPEDKEDFIDSLFDKYNDKIHAAEAKYMEQRVKVAKENVEKLRQFLLQDSGFEKCTNVNLRRDYVYGQVIRQGDYDFTHVTNTEIRDTIEDVWRQVKLRVAMDSKQ